jgi:hypothetical protein
MTLKASWLWNGTARSNGILFGFSETWYTDDSPAALLPKMQQAAQARALLLANGTSLYGYRISDTAPGSRAYTQLPGTVIKAPRGNGTPNVPQDAVLCAMLGTVAGTRKLFWLHDLPDNAVEDGELGGNQSPDTVRVYLNLLANLGFKFRYIVQSAPTGRVGSIDANGNVITLDPITGIAPRNVVQLLKVRGVDGRAKKGKFYVESVTDESHFKLAAWTGGVVNISGKIRLVQYQFTSLTLIPQTGIGSDATIRVGTRKCGRPFGQLRGRAVARR